jgi:hypothetical protein
MKIYKKSRHRLQHPRSSTSCFHEWKAKVGTVRKCSSQWKSLVGCVRAIGKIWHFQRERTASSRRSLRDVTRESKEREEIYCSHETLLRRTHTTISRHEKLHATIVEFSSYFDSLSVMAPKMKWFIIIKERNKD